MKCSICEERKARRYCPGLGTGICSLCCGREREVSISCPFDCAYLEQARLHERPPEIDPKDLPHPEIRVAEEFLRDHEDILTVLGSAILESSLAVDGAVDSDARQALESLVQTYRTLESGLYYESRPENPLAASIFRGIQEQLRGASFRDSEILTMLVFLERVEASYNNGRPKGRAFLDFLRQRLPAPASRKSGGLLIQTP